MKDLDLIIKALEAKVHNIDYLELTNKALAAAKRLRALKNHKDVVKELDARSGE